MLEQYQDVSCQACRQTPHWIQWQVSASHVIWMIILRHLGLLLFRPQPLLATNVWKYIHFFLDYYINRVEICDSACWYLPPDKTSQHGCQYLQYQYWYLPPDTGTSKGIYRCSGNWPSFCDTKFVSLQLLISLHCQPPQKRKTVSSLSLLIPFLVLVYKF